MSNTTPLYEPLNRMPTRSPTCAAGPVPFFTIVYPSPLAVTPVSAAFAAFNRLVVPVPAIVANVTSNARRDISRRSTPAPALATTFNRVVREDSAAEEYDAVRCAIGMDGMKAMINEGIRK